MTSSRPSEYPEGRVFVYDVLKSSRKPIINYSLIISFTQIYWMDSCFFLCDGQVIEKVNFSDKKRDTIFVVEKGGVVNSFSPSPSNNNILLSIKKTDTSETSQEVQLVNTVEHKVTVIAKNVDVYLGEDIRPDLLWSPNSDRLFLRDIENRLYESSLSNKSANIIDSNVIRLYYADNMSIYFTKLTNDTLFLHKRAYRTGKQFEMLAIPGGNIDFVQSIGKTQELLIIGVDDNILIYDPSGKVEKMTLPATGKYLFANNKFAIQQRGESLYLYHVTIE